MTEATDLEALRLRVVDLRADLRFLRQALLRRKRTVARTMVQQVSRSSTAREREQELEWLVHEDAEVVRLEDEILAVQREEERGQAHLDNANREAQQYQWLVRERMADSNDALAISIAKDPLSHIVLSVATCYGEKSGYTGSSPYILERELE
jgi:hypothetical protein